MRRFASLAGVSLIAGGLTAFFLFATSARALPVLDLGGVSLQQNGSSTTSTTAGSTTSTTGGGNGSGETTTTSAAPTTTTTSSGATTTSTAAPTTTTSTTAAPSAAITTSTQAVQAGGTVQVNGTGWPPNTSVSFVLNSQPVNLGSVTSGANGSFSIALSIPSTVSAGSHTLTASGGGQTASLTLVVSGTLAATGMSWNLLVLSIALVSAGIIVLAGDRLGRQELVEFVDI